MFTVERASIAETAVSITKRAKTANDLPQQICLLK